MGKKLEVKNKGQLLQVAELGQPVIRNKSITVKNIKSVEFQTLIDDLIATVKEVEGVGIAAPQVFKGVKIFILASYPNVRYPKAPNMKPTAVINPQIVDRSQSTVKDWEGCLSIPGVRGLVSRSEVITAEYLDREGNEVEKKYSGFVARIFQHEFDHLDGVLFVDRMDSMKDLITDKEYKRMMAKKYKK